MPHETVPQELFGSTVDPLDLMRAEDDGMVASAVALMRRTEEALGSSLCPVRECVHVHPRG